MKTTTTILLALLALGAPEAQAEQWMPCANEGGNCRFAGTRQVRFGAGPKIATRTAEGSVACSTGAFGRDPAPGKAKSCSYLLASSRLNVNAAPPAWVPCAKEGGVCQFNGMRKVVYGIDGKWMHETFVGAVRCSNSVFGDPAPGKVKECRYAR